MSTNQLPDARQRGKRRAKKVGLIYVNNFDLGIRRRRCGRGFVYLSPSGKKIRSLRHRQRIEALVIPPAWREVWICPKTTGHIQAVGFDDNGRKQYIYHPKWQAISSATKYDRMHLMAEVLPRVRRRIRRDLNGRKLTKQRVLAAVVRLIDIAHLRIGNEQYTKQNGSCGATTLAPQHVEVHGFTISLEFPGKSGQHQAISFTDKQIAPVVRRCEEIDGQYLFCYRDDDGEYHAIESTDVNEYLRDVARESITAKDFRTWWGSVIALANLYEMARLGEIAPDSPVTKRKKAISAAVNATAKVLGNTKAVCRGSYIHPGILAAAESGELPLLIDHAEKRHTSRRELTRDENLFADLMPHLDFS